MVHCMNKSQFKDTLTSTYHSSGSRVGEGGMDPLPCKKKKSKKLATKGGCIDFMFLGSPTQPLGPLWYQASSVLLFELIYHSNENIFTQQNLEKYTGVGPLIIMIHDNYKTLL